MMEAGAFFSSDAAGLDTDRSGTKARCSTLVCHRLAARMSRETSQLHRVSSVAPSLSGERELCWFGRLSRHDTEQAQEETQTL